MTTTTDIGSEQAPENERFGTSRDSLLDRRDRLHAAVGLNLGKSRLFRGVLDALLTGLGSADPVLEVDAAGGLITRALLQAGHQVVALEPTFAYHRELGKIEHPHLQIIKGFTDDLPPSRRFGAAVVSFSARRGLGLLAQVNELLPRVKGPIYMLLADDGSLDWAYLLRAVALEGLVARAEFLVDRSALLAAGEPEGEGGSDQAFAAEDTGAEPQNAQLSAKRAILLFIDAKNARVLSPVTNWEPGSRVIQVPYPAVRGVATRLMRYFTSGGDRAVLIKTEEAGITRLYGNLRTAAHRLARDEVTVRRVEEGVQLLLIPQVRSRRSFREEW